MTVPWSAVRRSAVRRWRTRTPLAAAHPGTILAAIVLAMIVLAGVGAPWLAPHDPLAQLDVIALKNRAPTFAFPLGTDPYSRDVLSRALFGARTSLLVGFVGAGVAVLLALAWGTCAGIAHARMGDRLMRLVDALRALPRKIVLLAIMLAVPRASVLLLALLLGLTSWTALSHVIFVQVRAMRGRDFVTAAHALGASRGRVMWRHVAPQLTGTLTAAGALLVADMLAVEAGLSFLGLGVRPPTASWGAMLQDGVPYLGSAWWIAATPCALLVVTVLSIARLADALHADRTSRVRG